MSSLLALGNDLGFGLGALIYKRMSRESPPIDAVTNPPPAWERKAKSFAEAVKDPVWIKVHQSREPFLWSQELYVEAGCPEVWEEQAPLGYSYGVSASLILNGGKLLCWGFDRSERLPRDDRARLELMAMTQLIGVYASEAVERICVQKTEPLTPTQVEVLKHVKMGRSSWTTAKLLGISESTVNFHVKRVTSALGVRTRLQAVHKAVEMGLLD